MSASDRDLHAAAVSALLCGVVVVTVPITAIRTLSAVPLCLLLPGYAIAAAAFAPCRPAGVQALLLAPALSLGALVAGSLVLDAPPRGLRLGSWTVLLVIVVLGSCGIAVARRRAATAARSRSFATGTWFRPRPRDLLLVLVAALIAGSALLLSRTPLRAPNAIGYTSLWMLRAGTPAAPLLRIGVTSAEQHPTTYRLLLTTGTGSPSVVASGLTLRPGSATDVTVPLAPVATGAPAIVTAHLYRAGRTDVYREVTAVIPPAASPPIIGPPSGHQPHNRASANTTAGVGNTAVRHR
jgi:Protein of unknown function (DUF1616)